MKKIVLIFVIIFAIASCKTEKQEDIPKDLVKVSGLIAHKKENTVEIIGRGDKEVVLVNPDGTFSKTFKLKNKGFYTLYDGKNKIILYLNGGDNIHVLYDYQDPNKLLEFKGKGAATNQFLAEKNKFERTNDFYNTKKLFSLKPEDFKKKIAEYKNKVSELLADKKIDSVINTRYKKEYDRLISNMEIGYKQNHLTQQSTGRGAVSPGFEFENYKGGKTSLKDLKGKNIYMDIWATWCGPCKAEIPALKELEKEYEGKNIAFISISVDEGRGYPNNSLDAAKKGWKKMIADKKMGGIQLFADNAWNSDFIKAFKVRSIPRFIIIDKNGVVIDADAPRPSSSKIKEKLEKLLLN